ncbi:hypothetical protein GWI33_014112 [Rhynchophorus ferrugineus]|uniref:Uncharacterized protein n=1 Tax=Rhynchophorus ferrugineus TaxID=354439 RepID=A0A834MCN7_RHYFE|nr:hypothetical protein GWI33_014112 [Rhynchophorus ferrugineus]
MMDRRVEKSGERAGKSDRKEKERLREIDVRRLEVADPIARIPAARVGHGKRKSKACRQCGQCRSSIGENSDPFR